MSIVCRTCVDDVISLSTYYICKKCERKLLGRIEKLEAVVEAANRVVSVASTVNLVALGMALDGLES